MLLFGRKKQSAAMYQKRKLVTVTFVDVTDSFVAKKMEQDGKTLLYVGFGLAKHPNKPQKGIFGDKVPAKFKQCLVTKEYAESIKEGDSLSDLIKETKKVTVVSKSKGKGFAGVMKRHGFHGFPQTHGMKDRHRSPGSIGTQGMDRVMKGRKMAGRMGSDQLTMKDRSVLGVQTVEDRTYMIIKGTLPGAYDAVMQLTFKEEKQNES